MNALYRIIPPVPSELSAPLKIAMWMALCSVPFTISEIASHLGFEIRYQLFDGAPSYLGFIGVHCVLLYLFSGPLFTKQNLIVVALGLALASLHYATVDYRGKGDPATAGILYIYYFWIWAVWVGAMLLALRNAEDRERAARVLYLTVLMLLLGESGNVALELTTLLHPTTYDAVLFQFDQAFGLQFSVLFGLAAEGFGWVKSVLQFVYDTMPMGFGLLIALQIRNRLPRQVDLPMFWVLTSMAAFLTYHCVPVAGPKYLFGDLFPASVPLPETVPNVQVILPPFMRNGVPSMHFGWALGLWMASLYICSRVVQICFFVVFVLTILATLGLGEHYLLDLVVAFPLVVALFAQCLRGIDQCRLAKLKRTAFAIFAAWLVFFQFGVDLAIRAPLLVVAFASATVVWSVRAVRWILRHPAEDASIIEENSPVDAGRSHDAAWIAGIFVLSGFSGLAYEVVFSKSLALVFGSTALATYTVLAVFMGGMSLGAFAGGLLAQRVARPLIAYAVCELFIGAYCVLTPVMMRVIEAPYAALAVSFADAPPMLTALRMSLGALVLLIPTVLMGATLPLLVRYFGDRNVKSGISVATLYGANTAGAALGALLTGYLIIPMLGVAGSTRLAAVLNLAVALAVFNFSKRQDVATVPMRRGGPEAGSESPDAIPKRFDHVVGLLVLTFGGAVTLALETVYIHLLAVVAGNSTYAFSLMVATFLLGLSGGAFVGRYMLARCGVGVPILAWAEFALAALLLTGVFGWDSFANYFADFGSYPLRLSFVQREFVRSVVCAVAMLPPAFAIGIVYPLAMELVARGSGGSRYKMLGGGMALNTLGNIAGVLIAGFVLIPKLGTLKSIQVVAIVTILLGCLAALSRRRFAAWSFVALTSCLVLFTVQPDTLNYSALASGGNVYFRPQFFGRTLDHAESLDGGLTTVIESGAATGKPFKTLLTNGKFQGNDAESGEVQAQAGIALVPLLHVTPRDSVLVIGYGTGTSSRVFHDAGFRSMEIAELSKDIVDIADRHFAHINNRVSTAAGVKLHISDGRNFLLLTERQYDVISMEISSIWFAGASSLYNREFYRLVHRHLPPHGILQQWVQLHHMRSEDLVSILATLRSEFRYVWIYFLGGQGVVVAGNDPSVAPSEAARRQLESTPALDYWKGLYGGNFDAVPNAQIATPDSVDALLKATGGAALISTDDNLRLEYGTPRGNTLDDEQSLGANLNLIRHFSKAGTPHG